MPSVYLAPSEFVTYGVPNATAAQVLDASLLIDAYLKRPEGLQWMPDYAGLPCYMAGLTASISFPLSQALAPGSNVVVPIAGAGMLSTFGAAGDVVILDRGSAAQGQGNNVEACVIGSIQAGSITLTSVAMSHASGTLMEFGLVIREQRTLPEQRSITRLANWPAVRILSGLGSYRYGRRSNQQAGLYQDQSIMAMMQTFGGPPEWTPFNITASDFSSITNEVWIPSGIFLAYYSDVRLYYIAGFSQANIPPLIKQLVANIITAKLNTADLVGGVKMARAGDTALQRFESTVLDSDMRQQLAIYRARLFV